MRMQIDKEHKEIVLIGNEIELSNLDSETKAVIDRYRTKKFTVTKFVSGNGNINDMIKKLILNNA